jgi:predicted nucleotidyltransferase
MEDVIKQKLSFLPDKKRKSLTSFADRIVQAFGERLYSMMLFGSAAGGGYIEGKSDINIMIILQTVRVQDLEVIMETWEGYARKGFAVPLVFETGHVVTSLDTFPIEFSDMKHRHIVLHGADPLADAVIDRTNLRYQCERELKSILVNLRRGFLRTRGKRENIEALLEDSLSSVLAACRGMIWMAEKEPRDFIVDLLNDLRDIYNTDTSAIDRVWRLRKGHSGATAMLEALFEDYIVNIAELAKLVDRHTY